MSHLGGDDALLLGSALGELHAFGDLSGYEHRVVRCIRRLVEADSYAYEEMNPRQNRVLCAVYPVEKRPLGKIAVFAETVGTHPVIKLWGEGDPRAQGHATAISDVASRETLARIPVYSEFYRGEGVEDQLAMLIDYQRSVMIAVAFNRGRRSFTARDREIMDLARPHLLLAYRNAEAVSRMEESLGAAGSGPQTGGEARRGVLTASPAGAVISMAGSAGELLGEYFPGWGAGGGCPDAVTGWLATTAAAGAASRRVLAQPKPGGLLVLRMMSDASSADVVILLEETATHAEEPGVPHLAPRLKQALAHMVEGRSVKEIAAAMRLSGHTVNEYVKAIYKAFGVASRAELMARCMRPR